MAKRRRFTAEFKAEVVLEALSGESSQVELCRRTPQPQRRPTLKVDITEARTRIGHFIT